jgi:hypothetical protein
MKKIITLLLLSFIISCANKKNSSAAADKLTNAEAEKLVKDFAEYKNNNYDGAGTAKIEKLVIEKITIKNDTAYINYEWSGTYKPPPMPHDVSPVFSKAEHLIDNVIAVKTKKGWSSVPGKE